MDTSNKKCANCYQPGAKTCSGCKNILYCSAKYQKADWSVHKIVCRPYATEFAERPIPEARRALYFPPDELEPRFVWVKDTVPPEYGTLMLGQGALVETTGIYHYPWTDEKIPGYMYVQCCTDLMFQGREPNHSIVNVVKGKTDFNPIGPWMVLHYDTIKGDIPDEEEEALTDMDTALFHVVIDWIRCYPSHFMRQMQGRSAVRRQERFFKTIDGIRMIDVVMIHCQGDISLLNKPSFELVKVPCSHALFTDAKWCKVGEIFGLAIWGVEMLTTDLFEGYLDNPSAADFFALDDKGVWSQKPGNVLVFWQGEDGEEVDLLGMTEVLCAWSKEVIQPLLAFTEKHIQAQFTDRDSVEAKAFSDKMHAEINEDKFEIFQKAYWKKKQNAAEVGETEMDTGRGGVENKREKFESDERIDRNVKVEDASEDGSENFEMDTSC